MYVQESMLHEWRSSSSGCESVVLMRLLMNRRGWELEHRGRRSGLVDDGGLR